MYFINSTKTLSVHSLLQEHRLGSYLVSTGTTSGWSAVPQMLLPLHCFLNFLPMASIMACFLPLYDLYNPNVPSSLRHGVPTAVNLSLPHTTSIFTHKHQCIRL